MGIRNREIYATHLTEEKKSYWYLKLFITSKVTWFGFHSDHNIVLTAGIIRSLDFEASVAHAAALLARGMGDTGRHWIAQALCSPMHWFCNT